MSKKRKKNEQVNYKIIAVFDDDQGHATVSGDQCPILGLSVATAARAYKRTIQAIKEAHGLDAMFLAIIPEKTGPNNINISKWIRKCNNVHLCAGDHEGNDKYLIMTGKNCGFIVPIVSMTKMNLATNITIAQDNEEINNEQKEEEK